MNYTPFNLTMFKLIILQKKHSQDIGHDDG